MIQLGAKCQIHGQHLVPESLRHMDRSGAVKHHMRPIQDHHHESLSGINCFVLLGTVLCSTVIHVFFHQSDLALLRGNDLILLFNPMDIMRDVQCCRLPLPHGMEEVRDSYVPMFSNVHIRAPSIVPSKNMHK